MPNPTETHEVLVEAFDQTGQSAGTASKRRAPRHNQPRTRLQKGPATPDRWTCTNSPSHINEHRQRTSSLQDDETRSEPLVTGAAFSDGSRNRPLAIHG